MSGDKKTTLRIATLAIAIALVAVFTMVIRIPLGSGYLNLCDVAIAFCAFTLGPVTAAVAGALGPAFADLAGGYAQWAVVSFLVHGIEGLVMALIVRGGKGRMAFSGVIIVTGGYYLLSALMLVGFEAAIADVPGNLVQSIVGSVFGLVLSKAVRKAYPPVASFAW